MIFFNNEKEKRAIEIGFTKMHGLGNDYLVINCIDKTNFIEENEMPKIARYLCNRNFGVGADGIILINKSKIADFKMQIYNSDGSEAQMCGNGMRCFSKYVYDNRLIEKREIKIETRCGIKIAYINNTIIDSNNSEITIDMGKAIFEEDKIPVIVDSYKIKSKEMLLEQNEEIIEKETTKEKKEDTKKETNKLVKINLKILEKELEAYCISIGNPHAVIFCEDVEKVPIEKFGSLIENDAHFPEKTNVEFIQVLGSTSIKMRVWERGVGETYACGTGACAVATICNILGITKDEVTVYLKGGELKIEINNSSHEIYMTGISTKVFEGKIKL